MNKLVKVISLVLIIAVVSVLSIALVACDKDKYEEVSLSKEDAVKLIAQIAEDTANVHDFEINIDSPDMKADFKVMAVDNKSALLGTLDGEEIFVGKFRQGEGYELYAGYYVKEDGEWEDAVNEFEGETAVINDLGCYEVIDILESIENIAEEATISAIKYLKNGEIQNYVITLSIEDESFELKTTVYDGKSVIETFKFTEGTNVSNYSYVYGGTFEIPER